MATKKGGLGKGLNALFSENAADEGASVEIRLAEIEPNRDQPRKDFDEQALADLAESIAQHGLLQPILVRPLPTGGYQIVAGERRWRACRMAGLASVPVIIRDMDNTEAMEVALIENLQREDLNPVEEALGYRTLIEEYGMTQEEAAGRVGKSRPTVANAIRLLGLEPDELSLVRSGEITAGHARALLGISDASKRKKGVELAKNGASVRELERLAREDKPARPKRRPSAEKKDKFYVELELAMKSELGRRVKITPSGAKGTIEIEFYSKDDLASIAARLAGNEW